LKFEIRNTWKKIDKKKADPRTGIEKFENIYKKADPRIKLQREKGAGVTMDLLR